MSKPRLLAAVLIGAAVIGAAVWWMSRSRPQAAPEPVKVGSPAPSVPAGDVSPAAAAKPAPVLKTTAVFLPADIMPSDAGKDADAEVSSRRIAPDTALAVVNGVTIVGKDLAPFPNTAEQSMSEEMLTFLLNRAIDRELVFQAARQEQVELDEAGQRELDRVRASLFKKDPAVIKPAEPDPATVEFEQRDATALLLRTALLNKAGIAAPIVTRAMVDQYYSDHTTTYGELPADPTARDEAWRKIELQIRNELVLQRMTEYAEGAADYLQKLRASASVQVLSP